MVEERVEGPTGQMVEPIRQKRGCLFWGSITLLILLVVVGALVGIIGYPIYRTVQRITSPTPAPIPVYQLKEGEYDALVQKIAAFENAPEPARLELTADDLNALIVGDPEHKIHEGKAFVRIEGDKFYIDVSFPLDSVPFVSFLFKGRYFNATYQLKLSLEGGHLKGIPEAIAANEEPLPEEMMARSRDVDVLEKMSPEKSLDFFKKARSVAVKDGKLVLER